VEFRRWRKTELFDHRVRFNASGYYFKYKNRQSISLEPSTNPNCSRRSRPARSARNM
jgi:hypothetical protein